MFCAVVVLNYVFCGSQTYLSINKGYFLNMIKFIHCINKTNKACYCTKSVPKAKNKLYSHTVLLPKTKFPLRLENQKLIERDEYIYNVADFENLYSWQRSHLCEPEFVLHDGPPYANGQPHMGHAINKILKDTILRYHILDGYKVHYVPGWDCHGLPIELKAISNAKGMNPVEIRSIARNFAHKTVNEQKTIFKSWGVIGDWKNAYFTDSLDYVKTQIRLFHKMFKNNLIYRDYKPIYWSPSTRTALAEAELIYNENHRSPSVYVRFEVNDIPKIQLLKNKRVYAIIWTTTPWTLPSNQAVCYNETISYSLVKKSDPLDTDVYIIATDLVDNVSSVFNCNFQLLNLLSGHLLEGATYVHPIYKDRVLPFLNGSHATATKGTGLVHTAPAHGPEDFLIALSNKLPVVNIVNEEGCYRSEAGLLLQDKYVLSEGTQKVLEIIKADLMHLGEITHSYPYDWRSEKPVIIRACQQWFIDTSAIKSRAVELLENVKILPQWKENYKKNLVTQIQKRPYWCISRQRKWGVPIPVFYNKENLEVIINENIINHLCNLLDQNGTDFWWNLEVDKLLPKNLYSAPSEVIEKSEDIMDIWFDSGISWAKVLEGAKVADIYLEGADQFNGWFQSSLLTSVALRDRAPYKTIYVHGFAVDENGVKMSKSLGNVVDPVEITKGKKGKNCYGVDVLRWWVACHANQTSLANVSPTVLQSSADEVQKIRSVLRFALSALADYQKSNNDQKNLLLIDKYMLHLLFQFHEQVTEAVSEHQFHKVSHLVINLLTNPVSALYYTTIKDRLYCDQIDSPTRRAAQYTLFQIFNVVTRCVAPIVPHLAEEMYLHLPEKDQKTYFTSAHKKPDVNWKNEKVESLMEVILNVKRDLNKEIMARTIDVDVSLISSKMFFNLMKDVILPSDLQNQLTDILQVSTVSVLENAELTGQYDLRISKSNKTSCPRCRRIQSEKENELCRRCSYVITTLKENKMADTN